MFGGNEEELALCLFGMMEMVVVLMLKRRRLLAIFVLFA